MRRFHRTAVRFAISSSFVVTLAAAGCLKIELPQAGSPPADADSASPEAAPAADVRPPLPETIASTRPDDTRPTTPVAFVEEFKQRFGEDFYGAFVELGYWDGTTEEHRKSYMAAVREIATHPADGSAGRLDPEIEVYDAAGYDYAFFPTEGDEEVQAYPAPTHILEVTTLFGDDGSLKQTNYFAIGQHDGKYYFSTIKPE